MAPSATSDIIVVPVAKVGVEEETSPKHVAVHGAEDKTPLEAISHGDLVAPGIPTFSSHAEERKHILIHTAAVFRDFSRKGFTEGMAGHISVRDPEYESYIWMNPLGKHFGLMTAGDLSRAANAAGFLIHSEIHKARPDVHAVCHAHTNAGRAWSSFARGIDMLNQDICTLYNSIAVYNEYGGIVFAEEEGKNIATALGTKNKVAILMNHGLLSTGSTVDEAGFLFGLLDRGCAIQLQVEAALAGNPNLKKHIVSDEEAAYNFKMASEKNALYAEAQPDLDYEFAMAGEGVIEKGVENQKID
ncbi:TqaM [Drepanopeziza brunnea f. sp. 'multigermtubi' MB_m1]|uniref:TqaM n=1 Tax=Marssonina brunnea f. sp. multigermtubi (strain MB_m1) TaxID=1072389 RepID=K1WUJ5_MARBU|nr:TqaM [Drepanopeziza brunnea f. sp. 'multigermtubi' MB_m1]EKD21355.1 TqaM [Drepanopeziza brunnea f. sp. 'multigermtubi' MB_m1]